ncbi:hypothetical protein B484DRAFT_445947 [Ochromonadaceae sp. CCMP2298]|nr:hypothetical protein B484DRAFT_445947 [Ochromonadaceae sp. CCMP2298]
MNALFLALCVLAVAVAGVDAFRAATPSHTARYPTTRQFMSQRGFELDFKKMMSAATLSLLLSGSIAPPAMAKDSLPSLDKCFNAVQKELDAADGQALIRIKADIDGSNWDDLKLFSREYDAGFRGGVLKSAWKQLEGDEQKRGIEVTNSFTFDLIALNKAARKQDTEDARARLEQVRQDLKDFLALRPASSS